MWFPRFVRGVQYLTLAACVVFVVLLFVYDPPVAAVRPTEGSDVTPAELGAQLFAVKCANCHGEEGAGGYGPPIGPELLDHYPDADDQRAFIVAGTGTMPGFGEGDLTAAELDAVVTYTREVLAGAEPVVASVDPEVAAQGRALYADRCASCHGDDATGGFGPALAGGKAVAAFPDEADQIAVVADGRNAMPEFGSKLTTEEIAAIVAYTRSL